MILILVCDDCSFEYVNILRNLGFECTTHYNIGNEYSIIVYDSRKVKSADIFTFEGFIYDTCNKLFYDNIYNIIHSLTMNRIFSDKLLYVDGEFDEEDRKANRVLFEACKVGINLDRNKKLKDTIRQAVSLREFDDMPLVNPLVSSCKDKIVQYKYFNKFDFIGELYALSKDYVFNDISPCRFCLSNVSELPYDANPIKNIVVKEYENFILKVGIGQICDNYLLLVTKRHIPSLVYMNENEKEELLVIMSSITNYNKTNFSYETIFLEHGVKAVNYFLKSVEHAHLHIVTKDVKLDKSFEQVDYMSLFKTKDMYHLYIKDNVFFISDVNTKTSQYWRKLVANKCNKEWDWRKTQESEEHLSNIQKLYRSL